MTSEPQDTLLQSDESAAHAQEASRQEKPEAPGYELLRPLGEGSFGQVWLARQLSTGQSVAIKFCSAPDLRYLRRELERLRDVSDHPGIVSLIDAQLERRPAFLVMPLLSRSLAQEIGTPDPARVAEWLRQLASALQHTHDQGLLHCDLKPSNVMLDESGMVRLVDFGQARQQSDQTTAWGTLGTMAPEQAQLGSEGANAAPSVRWDIYGLGATFYRLLTGRLPYLGEERLRSLPSELSEKLRAYREQLLATSLTPIRKLNPRVDSDLADLVEACLAQRPERRPPSMGAILEDLSRRSDGLPLLCRRPWPLGYRVRKVLRRPTVLVSLAAACLIVGGAAYSYVQLRDANQRQARSLQELLQQRAARAESEGKEEEALLVWGQALQNAPDDAFLRTRLAADRYPVLDSDPESNAVFYEIPGRPELLADDEGKLVLCSRDRREPLSVDMVGVRASPDGRRLALARADQIEVYDLPTRKIVARWPMPAVSQLAWRGDREVVTLRDGRVSRWSVTGVKQFQLALKGNPQELKLTEDGEWVLDLPGSTRYSTENGHAISMPGAYLSPASEVSPDGSWLAAQDARTSAPLLLSCRGASRWQPQHDGRVVCFCGPSNVVLADGTRIWIESPTGAPVLEEPLEHRSNVLSACSSRDGKFLLTATEDERLNLWDSATGRCLTSKCMRWKDCDYGFNGDHSAFYATNHDGARLWALNEQHTEWKALDSEEVRGLEWGPNQKYLLVVTANGFATLTPDGQMQAHEQTSERVCSWTLSPQGAVLLQFPTSLVLYPDSSHPQDKELLGTLDNASYQCLADQRLAFSPEGNWLAANLPGKLQLWQVENGKPRLAFGRDLPQDAEAVAVAPEGQQLAAFSGSELHLWSPTTGEETKVPVNPENGPPSELRYLGDWLWVRRGSELWTRRWRTGERLGYCEIKENFDPDAPSRLSLRRGLISLEAGYQQLAVPELRKLGVPVPVGGVITSSALDPDGSSWAAANDVEVQLVDLAGVAPLRPAFPVKRAQQLLFGKGHRLLVAPESGGVESYRIPWSDGSADALTRQTERQTGYRLDENFRMVPLTRQEWLDRAPQQTSQRL